MLEFIRNILPSSVVHVLANNRMILFAMYKIRSIIKLNSLDKVMIQLLIKTR